jgi:hypothetical protein
MEEPIASFQPTNMDKFYLLEKGTWKFDEELLGGFKCMEKTFLNIWYKLDKSFKHRPVDILLANLIKSIAIVKESNPRTFSDFHMSSYLLGIIYMMHQYPKMGWA